MTDHELWSEAVGRATGAYLALPVPVKQRLVRLVSEIRALKDQHQRLVANCGAQSACERCTGICCRYGKHHFTAVELIAFLAADRELLTPDFENPVCPYIGGSGCMMEPAFRPFNCIIFLCEDLDSRLDDSSRAALMSLEADLRVHYQQIDHLLGNRFGNGLLITYQRSVDTGSPMFDCKTVE